LDESSSPTLGTIEATYDYATADGSMLAYQVVRLHPKDFRQRREDPTIPGRWIWNIQGCRKLLYQLPSLCAALEGAIPSRLPRGWVVVVEGERDVETCWAADIPATCNSGGAGKWTEDHADQLVEVGVKVAVVIPDHDLPGEQHGRTVCRTVRAAGLET